MTQTSFDDLKELFNWYSTAISTAVRTTSFGVIGAIWAVFTADGLSVETTGLLGVSTQDSVKAAFMLASAAIFADIFQYACGYFMSKVGMERLQKNPTAKFSYNVDNLGCFGYALYRLSFALFLAKLMLAVSSAVAFFFVAFAISVV